MKVVCVHCDIASPMFSEHSDTQSLYRHLQRVFNNAYYSNLGRPIITMFTREINNINGRIEKKDTTPSISIYISEKCKLSDDGRASVINPRTGMVVQTSGGYIIMNQKMEQLYPVLDKNQRTALDEFVSTSFSKFSDSKQKTK